MGQGFVEWQGSLYADFLPALPVILRVKVKSSGSPLILPQGGWPLLLVYHCLWGCFSHVNYKGSFVIRRRSIPSKDPRSIRAFRKGITLTVSTEHSFLVRPNRSRGLCSRRILDPSCLRLSGLGSPPGSVLCSQLIPLLEDPSVDPILLLWSCCVDTCRQLSYYPGGFSFPS